LCGQLPFVDSCGKADVKYNSTEIQQESRCSQVLAVVTCRHMTLLQASALSLPPHSHYRCCCCCQVVAFQAMMEMMAETFPGAFSGYTLKVRGSYSSMH
jgi:hypothetical protein